MLTVTASFCYLNWSIIQDFTSDLKLNLKAALWLAVNNMGLERLVLTSASIMENIHL